MKEIGQKLGIEIGTIGESIEVMIKEAIDVEQDHWDRYVQQVIMHLCMVLYAFYDSQLECVRVGIQF